MGLGQYPPSHPTQHPPQEQGGRCLEQAIHVSSGAPHSPLGFCHEILRVRLMIFPDPKSQCHPATSAPS